MMQRKKHTPITPSISASPYDDNAKHKTPSRSTSLQKILCLPGVPAPLKCVLATFLSFAALMVLTAKDHRAVFHYVRGKHHLPEPLRVTLKKKMEGGSYKRESVAEMHEQILSETASDGTISFVESEKRLKKQLLKLLALQKEERMQYHGKRNPNENESVLGVKIANRYLGEDMLPFPKNKGDENDWEKSMEARKDELRKNDERQWKEMMAQYDEVMEDVVHLAAVGYNDQSDTKQERQDAQPVIDDQYNNSQLKSWPSPTDLVGPDTTILLEPAFGSHRSNSNAIFVFAEGYDLNIYLAFVESLSNSGYKGDVVISISTENKLKPGVKDYLTSKNTGEGLNIVGYEVEWNCFKQSGEVATGSNEGMNHCQMNHVFGDEDKNNVKDPREARPVATARYELYWMWSLKYDAKSWIMLIDARDAWFQLDPFVELDGDIGENGGELHLFGENADAVRIGTSNYNRKWLISAYGQDNVKPYFEEPVICSGSTIGHQIAIESYLRAMVAQFDSTNCKSKGCDQGFHNYLYYSGQLGDDGAPIATGISKVIVHDQGNGIINNLAALREKPLSEWKLYDAEKELVLNWDGSTSAVAHQYDRDKEVNAMVKKKKRYFEQHWKDDVIAQI